MKRVDLVKRGGFRAGEHLATRTVEAPTPGAHQVVIQVMASAINPVDWKMAEYGILLPEDLPAALGCDVAGVVVQSPSDDEHWVGKRVLSYLGASKAKHTVDKGAFVEQVVVDKDLIVEIPQDMSFAEAASLPVGALTAKLLLEGFEEPDEEDNDDKDWILVWGASSSVGFNVVQLAKKMGFKVVAVASGSHQASLTELGADGFLDYRQRQQQRDDWKAKLVEMVGDGNLNGAVDCIGTAATFGAAAELVHELGRAGALGATKTRAVSTTLPLGVPPTPDGVASRPVDLASVNEGDETRAKVSRWLREIVHLKALPIHSIAGPVAAETVERAFQVNKDGVSGKKVVIEWG